MRYLSVLPRYLLNLTFPVRLAMAIFSVSLVMIVYILMGSGRNPSILAIPVVLIAWTFGMRGVLLSIPPMFVILWGYFSFHFHTLFLPSAYLISFVAGTLALIVIGLLISSQRDSLDLSDAARRQLALAYEQQQRLNQAQDQFLQNVNHELRTPLTAIYSYVETLLDYGDRLDPEMHRDFLKHAMYCCDELQLLVNNVLDTLQIDNAREHLHLEDFPVATIVREVLTHTDPRRVQEYNIAVEIPEQLVVYANAQYLRQILRNLLSNTFKYTPAGTPITISALPSSRPLSSEDGQQGALVCIRVKDAGPGIPPEELSLLFGQFVRLKRDISGTVRGTGLGLHISKQLVEAMGGRIWVESSGVPGEGSCFSFTLPAALSTSPSRDSQQIERVRQV